MSWASLRNKLVSWTLSSEDHPVTLHSDLHDQMSYQVTWNVPWSRCTEAWTIKRLNISTDWTGACWIDHIAEKSWERETDNLEFGAWPLINTIRMRNIFFAVKWCERFEQTHSNHARGKRILSKLTMKVTLSHQTRWQGLRLETSRRWILIGSGLMNILHVDFLEFRGHKMSEMSRTVPSVSLMLKCSNIIHASYFPAQTTCNPSTRSVMKPSSWCRKSQMRSYWRIRTSGTSRNLISSNSWRSWKGW